MAQKRKAKKIKTKRKRARVEYFQNPPLNQMLTNAVIDTNARKVLTEISSAGAMRAASGTGGGGPGYRWRQTAAPKQKTLNSKSTLAVVIISHSGKTPTINACAPIPLAIAKRPVRTQAA